MEVGRMQARTHSRDGTFYRGLNLSVYFEYFDTIRWGRGRRLQELHQSRRRKLRGHKSQPVPQRRPGSKTPASNRTLHRRRPLRRRPVSRNEETRPLGRLLRTEAVEPGRDGKSRSRLLEDAALQQLRFTSRRKECLELGKRRGE